MGKVATQALLVRSVDEHLKAYQDSWLNELKRSSTLHHNLGRRKRLAHTYPPAHFDDRVVCRKTEQKAYLFQEPKKIDRPC